MILHRDFLLSYARHEHRLTGASPGERAICECKAVISCAWIIWSPGRVCRTSPPSNPRLDGQRIYITLPSKQASSTVQPRVGRSRTTSFLMWRHAGSAEEAYISLFTNRLPLYSLGITINDDMWSHPWTGSCHHDGLQYHGWRSAWGCG